MSMSSTQGRDTSRPEPGFAELDFTQLYDALRKANEHVQDLQSEICRFKYARNELFTRKQGAAESLESAKSYVYNLFNGFDEVDPPKSEWWQSASRSGLLDSIDNIDRELEPLNASMEKLSADRDALRIFINNMSRPCTRSLHILDLPDELLVSILEQLEGCGPEWPCLDNNSNSTSIMNNNNKWASRADFQNARLVCRRFCDLSSHLLVRVVRVTCDESSLWRLDQISRHPTISQGVRAVEVLLQFYNTSFHDFDSFISYRATEAESELEYFEHYKLWENLDIPAHDASQLIAERHAAISALADFAWPDEHSEDEYEEEKKRRLSLLLNLYEQYLLRGKRQAALLDREFSSLAGSAIARMPAAQTISFGDTEFLFLRDSYMKVDDSDFWNNLCSGMLQPLSGFHVLKQYEDVGLDLPSYRCVVDILEAALHFDVEGTDALASFLSSCLETDSVESIKLEMGEPETAHLFDAGKILRSRPRKNLQYLKLRHLSLDLPTLAQWLKQVLSRFISLKLEAVYLSNGTWAEVLDLLRDTVRCYFSLHDPSGAECETMPDEAYDLIFEGNDSNLPHLRSKAEIYVNRRWQRLPNPIRELEDGISPG